MRKIILMSVMITAVVCNLQAQKTKPTTKPKPAPPVPALKNLTDSASYAIGVSVANFYKTQGVSILNTALVAKAISDILANKKPLMDEMQANSCVMNFMNKLQSEKSKPNTEAGEKFLAQNKMKAGVKTLPSGLQYEIIKQGDGALPTAADTVVAHYAGTLIDGTEFDNSYKRGEPITISVGGVIRGWTEALQLMPAGSKWKIYIPHQLGYGPYDNQLIPGGSVLIFEIELLQVKGK